MAAPEGANQIARYVIDDLIKFSGETFVDGYMSFFKSHQIAKSCGFINQMREEDNRVKNLVGIMETEANDMDHSVNYDNDNDINDLGYELEVYLDEEEQEDENIHSNGNVFKRGITRLSKFRKEYGKPDRIKLSVTFDALNRISGSHRALFLSFLEDQVREHIETKDKIKEGTLKVDHGTDAMTFVLGKEKGGYARGVGSGVTYKRHNEEVGTSLRLHGWENDASIQKSNGLATLENEMETMTIKCKLWHLKKSTIIALGTVYKTGGKRMLHKKGLPKDCYKVSVDKSLVDVAYIPNAGNNSFKTVKDTVGGFFAWPKDQVVLDLKVTPPSTIQMIGENKIAP
nr:hypothetical protein [Tanacetum cinerariifolium]